MSATHDVVVIGAGPGGLAAAAACQREGRTVVVLERADAVGTSWRHHYDRLRLHTPARLSGLPGLAIPRRYGRWITRQHVVDYLEQYARHHQIDVRTGVTVERVDRADQRDGGGEGSGAGRWVVRTSSGPVTAEHVIVATGYNHTPVEPTWPGIEGFAGEVVHAKDYRNGSPFAGRSVLVVGIGNTGAEIATDLHEHGASQVWIAVRTAPHIVRRSSMGISAQQRGIVIRHLPTRVVDALAAVQSRVEVPDLSDHGLPRPTTGLYSRVKDGSIPVQDVGIVRDIRSGAVVPVPAVAAFDGPEIELVDGRRIAPDVVLLATGYTQGLEPLVGHLGVLEANGRPVVHGAVAPAGAPGLWFTGFTNPISGMFRELAIDARRIAAVIADPGRQSRRRRQAGVAAGALAGSVLVAGLARRAARQPERRITH